MTVELSYYAQIRLAAGGASERVEAAAGTTVTALLQARAEKHGDAFRRLVLDDTGRVRAGIIVLVNDRPLGPGAAPTLAEGDRVSLFSPVAGG